MGVWWMSEAMPLAVTSLLPVVVLPLFEIVPLQQAIAPFASSIIFLFLGGFIISAAMQKWHLQRRFALAILSHTGCGPKSILAGLIAMTCFMAMWVSNTATAIMMLPLAISMAGLLSAKSEVSTSIGHNPFAKALIMGIAFSAAIGGLGTFVGTPTNAILQGHMQKIYGYELDLMRWMSFGVPMVIIIATIAWALLSLLYIRKTKLVKNAGEIIAQELAKLGPMQRGEKTVAFIFLTAVGLWVGGGFLEDWFAIRLEDAVVSILAALLLFLVPTNFKKLEFSMNWADAERIPWGVLIFFGGTLSLSSALTDTGVTMWLSTKLEVLHGVGLIYVVVVIVGLMILVSEFMSNVATITAFLPILSALAGGLGVNPLLILVPATLAASCGFMMPGASAPNALAYSTGHLKVRDLVRMGAMLDVISITVITICTFTIVALALDITPGVIPQWAMLP